MPRPAPCLPRTANAVPSVTALRPPHLPVAVATGRNATAQLRVDVPAITNSVITNLLVIPGHSVAWGGAITSQVITKPLAISGHRPGGLEGGD